MKIHQVSGKTECYNNKSTKCYFSTSKLSSSTMAQLVFQLVLSLRHAGHQQKSHIEKSAHSSATAPLQAEGGRRAGLEGNHHRLPQISVWEVWGGKEK